MNAQDQVDVRLRFVGKERICNVSESKKCNKNTCKQTAPERLSNHLLSTIRTPSLREMAWRTQFLQQDRVRVQWQEVVK